MEVTNRLRTIKVSEDKAELKNAKLLYVLMSVLLIADWVMPQYFGVHIGFDFTSTRILNVLIILYFLYNREAGKHFLKSILDVQVTPYLALYMFVMVYTTVFRVNVNTFFLNFLDILTFYMVYYGIRYVIGVGRAIDWTVKCAWFIGIYGIVEYILGFSPMVQYLMTVPSSVKIIFRSGQYRVMGPCGHSIGYGMMLMFLIAVICIDYEKDEIYLFKHPVLYMILMVNMFLTGSRGPLGLAVLETILIIIFSKRQKQKKTLLVLCVVIVASVLIECAIYNTSIGRYIMMQITSVIDEAFGTNYAVNYGADVLWLSQSSDYRDLLPKVFTVDWLNPLIGQGANAAVGFEFDGRYVKSIDNFYVALYIRYAYPGLISFVLVQIMSIVFMAWSWIKNHSGTCLALAIGILVYSINLYWVDYLQTTKYMYILMGIYCAYYSERILGNKNK